MASRGNDASQNDGFLSRWSRRKQDQRAGVPVDNVPPAATALRTAEAAVATVDGSKFIQNKPPGHTGIAQAATDTIADGDASTLAPAPAETQPPAPTLLDAQALTPQSDFKPFMAGNVPSEVKNAAMKKLFADPHYNVMDMMDTYVDDYSKSDPIPESMLKEMVSVKFLKLFERDEEDPEKTGLPRDDADTPAAQSVAQLPADAPSDIPSQPSALDESPLASPPPHDDPDLRLQPHHAAERPHPGSGAG